MSVNSFDNYPMSWKPSIDRTEKVLYKKLAAQLVSDIQNGILLPGTKLPPQRELADYLDINLSTVTRAFKICESQGYICSAIGKGTFVSSDAAADKMLKLNHPDKKIIEMGALLPNSQINSMMTDYLSKMTTEPDFYKMLEYGTIDFYDSMLMNAATKWLSLCHLESSPDQVLYAGGGQNAIFAILSTLFRPGDRIATTPMAYPGIKVAAKFHNIEVVPLNLENGEITKNTLTFAYQIQKIKGLYLIPDYNNPTTENLSLKTRKMIGAFCSKHHLPVMEDGIYTLFEETVLPPISSFTKEGIYFSSISKLLAPGIRLSVIHSPEKYYSRLKECLYAMNITNSPLMLQLFARVVASGTYKQIIRKRIDDVILRNQLFDTYLGTYTSKGDSHCPMRWLTVPSKYTADEFENELYKERVQVYSATRFSIGNTVAPNAVRISLISTPDLDEFERGLQIIQNKFC